jgi:hypothetical protein
MARPLTAIALQWRQSLWRSRRPDSLKLHCPMPMTLGDKEMAWDNSIGLITGRLDQAHHSGLHVPDSATVRSLR